MASAQLAFGTMFRQLIELGVIKVHTEPLDVRIERRLKEFWRNTSCPRCGHQSIVTWNEQFEVTEGVENDEHGILHTIVVSLHHDAARGHTDYSWSVSDPVVVEKPSAFQAGEQQVLREIACRTNELGSVSRAVDTLATDVHGWSKSSWAKVSGRNPSTVTRTTDN